MWQLPQGQVSYLVLALAAVGILSSLFVWPLRGEKNNQWVQAYLSYFYWIFLPLLAFLYVAIGRRIIDYGITPDRYYVMLATFWLSFIVIYFMLSKKKNIKLIPATFSLLCILTCFGPWGVFSVSERSQINRLQTILEENKILVDKKIAEPLPIIDDSTTIVINQMISFIYTDCSDGILEKLAHKWNIEQDSAAYVYSHAEFSSALGLKNTYTSLRAQERFFWRDTNKSPWRRGLIAVSGYHYFVEEQTMHFRDQANHKFRNSDDTVKVAVGQDIYKIAITEEAQNLQILLNDSILLERSIVHELDSLMKNGIIHDSSLENDETISFIESSEKIEFKFLISSFNADIANDTSSLYPFRLTSFGFYMLIKNSDYSESEEF
ncbi:hypothetical protein AwDysgo_14240 [Bacteroidales bacterium]|nr:hypothetical protein AwDysgo_14240 [Bacteroidales bacterium]